MKRFLHVVPAYGRDYKSKKELLADWNAGKDFRICDISSASDGAYVNKEELSKLAAIRIVRKAA